MHAAPAVVVALVTCLVAIGPASANAACPRPPKSEVLARSSRGIVWDTGLTIRGCLDSTGRSRVLTGTPTNGTTVARLAGRYAAAGASECDKIDGTCSTTTVVVKDLRTGRTTVHATYGEGQDGASAAVDDLSLSPTGALVELLHVADNREVWLLCPRARQRLTARPAAELGDKLVRSRGTVSWTTPDGKPTAGIRPRCRS